MPAVSEPSEESQRIIEIFRWFRGGTLSGFSQVEFSLCRLLSRLRQKPEFASGLEQLPYKAEARSQKFRAVFSSNDMLSPYAAEAIEICDAFDHIIELRNFLAHGFARIDMPGRVVQLRKFQPTKEDTWNEAQWDIPFEKMELWGAMIDDLTQSAVALCLRVSKELDLGF